LPAIIVGIAVGIATAGAGAPAVFAGMLGGAAAGAVNTGVNGGNLGLNVLFGAAVGGIGAAFGPPLYGALGRGFWGAVGTGAIFGGAFGAVGAGIRGGNVLEGFASGALGGALVAAAVYGAVKLYESAKSPALAGDGAEAEIRSAASKEDKFDIAARRYERLTGENLSGVKMTEDPTLGPFDAKAGPDTVFVGRRFFDTSPDQLLRLLGHEFRHVTQIRTIPYFFDLYRGYSGGDASGYWYNPFEYEAELIGARFASRALGRPIAPDPRYRLEFVY
jgi:hypothetical protein